MNKLNLKRTLSLLVFIGISLALSSKGHEATKTISKEYDVNSDAQLEILNKYGDVSIKDWNKNTIKIEVTITAKSGSVSSAEKLLDLVGINFSATNAKVRAETQYPKLPGSKSSMLSVDYKITMPASNSLIVNNHFGDVFVSNLKGSCNAKLSYGNFQAGDLNGENQLTLSYVTGVMGSMQQSDMTLAYTQLDIQEVEVVKIVSKYSNITLGEIKTIEALTKYDQLSISEAEKVVIESKFTTVTIGQLEKGLDAIFKYGLLEVDEVADNFQNIDIENTYGELNIGFSEKASFNLEAEMTYCKLRYPPSGSLTISTEGNTSNYEGTVGSKSNPSSTVRINSKYGGAKLKSN